jgi:putative transposase
LIQACAAVGLSRAAAYRHLALATKPIVAERAPRPVPTRRIPDAEREHILAVLDSDSFIDQPVREVYATLLSEGVYFCSWRTMHRLLKERGPVRERRNHREPRKCAVPRLEATAPNQVWTWDISKLATVTPGVFLNLYVVLDLFSRYVVAWMVAERENSALAKQLFAESVGRYNIDAGDLTVHQDRGAPMTSHTFCDLLSELGVDRSYSRPRVSNDNPYSESHFHTVKYQPDYPGRFRDIAHAREWLAEFFEWYNDAHHHTGLALFTPANVFFGRVDVIAATREQALAEAYARTPERFVHGPPRVARPPARVSINPPELEITAEQIIQARDEELEALWTPTPQASSTPVIHLPGAPSRHPGGAPELGLTT